MGNIRKTLVLVLSVFVFGVCISTSSNTYDSEEELVQVKKCYKELGCFESEGFFHALYRPVNFFPDKRALINTMFAFFSRKNPIKEHLLMWSSPISDYLKLPFNASKPTKVITHGWLDAVYFGQWMTKMKNALLLAGDYNVITVDWRGGNGLPYAQATANTRLVGAEIAVMIEKLQKVFKANVSTFHIMGHSLGAHVAGYAGERIPGLGRITGLDPADPYFQHMPAFVRLDPTDARFVDILHTDGGTVLDLAMRSAVVCNHERAVTYYLETVSDRSCKWMAFVCPSYHMYKRGQCSDCGHDGSRCARMGFYADQWKPRSNTSVRMYLQTMSVYPYCAFQYSLIIELYKDDQTVSATGYFTLTLHGESRSADIQINKKPLTLYPRAQHPFLVTTDKNVGKIIRASFSYESNRYLFFRTNLQLWRVRVLSMNEGVLRDEKKNKTLAFCYHDKAGIPPGEGAHLIPC
ncbi:pancreatic lipase-related protein 2-like isoform X2 [Dermacentor andersoni]|uniref:pancreatic lipase-related protein 2-like isoform X2 n=1 Tax=Dermacentor andersoni TaxID=34620 RepID=UPI00241781E0|nr:pancreatic lipase-related protein 2-like isoform X2 [Dermacentor andersoni]